MDVTVGGYVAGKTYEDAWGDTCDVDVDDSVVMSTWDAVMFTMWSNPGSIMVTLATCP